MRALSPGFIDIHIHGSGGHDTMEKAFLYKALDSVKECMNGDSGGAAILGAHLEGPFINEGNIYEINYRKRL